MNTHALNHDQQEIWDTLITIGKAIVQKDAAVFEQRLSPDFVGATPTGAYFGKEAYIQYHCNNNFGVMSIVEDMDNTSIRLFGNTAVVNRRAHSQFKLPAGNIVEYDVQRMEVLVKVNNQWMLVSGQGTQVIPIPKASGL